MNTHFKNYKIERAAILLGYVILLNAGFVLGQDQKTSGKNNQAFTLQAVSPGLVMVKTVPGQGSPAVSFSEAAPLDSIAVFCPFNGTIHISDGKGKVYVRESFRQSVVFVVAGALGNHTVCLIDKDGKEYARQSFIVDAKTAIDDGAQFKALFDLLYKGMCVYAPEGVESSEFNGKTYHYFVSWVLDNYNTNLGMRYFQPYASEMIDLFSQVQWENGMIPSNIQQGRPGYYDLAYGPLNYIKRYGNTFFPRQPNENHVEYLYVNLMYKAWKASGDTVWMKNKLHSASMALDYCLKDSLRWSNRFQLLKRPYTIDSWDFQVDDEYTPQEVISPTMNIVPGKTKFGIFFGDNTGYVEACRQLAEMMTIAGDKTGAETYRRRAEEVNYRLNALSWNGKFFTHFIDEDPTVKRNLGVDEKSQVAQFNAYSINRGLTHEQNVAIIKTYLDLKDHLPKGSPGEWYSIYPPFEKGFGSHNAKWQYMNGGVAGHAAGELARGAFENGFESYGSDILNRLLELGVKYGKSERIWFSYTGCYPDPPPSPEYSTMNLASVCNMDLTDQGASNVSAWMAERPGNDMRNLPVGNQIFNEVPFLVTDPSENMRKAVIAVSRQKGFPAEMRIPVKKKAAAIHLLNTVSGVGSEGIAGAVEFLYDDGTSRSQYIINGKQVTGWWFPSLRNEYAQVAWRGPNGVSNDVGLCQAAILNPEPDKVITALKLLASEDKGIYVVAGITLASQVPYHRPSAESYGGPDNWAGALGMAALVEGLAGITDLGVKFNNVRVAPRWTSSGTAHAKTTIRYAASDGYVSYSFSNDPKIHRILIWLAGSGDRAICHVLLPPGSGYAKLVKVNGQAVPFQNVTIEKSIYADFEAPLFGCSRIEIDY